MNSSIAWRYHSWELGAANEFSTAFFDCSRSGRRRTVFARGRLPLLCRCAINAASLAASTDIGGFQRLGGCEPRFGPVAPITLPCAVYHGSCKTRFGRTRSFVNSWLRSECLKIRSIRPRLTSGQSRANLSNGMNRRQLAFGTWRSIRHSFWTIIFPTPPIPSRLHCRSIFVGAIAAPFLRQRWLTRIPFAANLRLADDPGMWILAVRSEE